MRDAMKAILQRTEQGLRGATPEDHEAWCKFRRRLESMNVGDYLRIEATKPRNGPHHRKLFALLTLVSENSETYDTTEKALVAVKLVAGYCDPFINPLTGELTQLPHSISYESMEQDAFDTFYKSAIDGILAHILPYLTRDKFDKLLDMIVKGWA